MSWFDEQIRQREKSDQNILEDSFFRMAGAVMDKWNTDRLADERLIAREALDVRYGFTLEQSACLSNEKENGRYLLFGEKELPCYEFYFTLGFDEEGYEGSGAGVYLVKVKFFQFPVPFCYLNHVLSTLLFYILPRISALRRLSS